MQLQWHCLALALPRRQQILAGHLNHQRHRHWHLQSPKCYRCIGFERLWCRILGDRQ